MFFWWICGGESGLPVYSSAILGPPSYFCFIDYAKTFDCVDHNKLGNSERDGNTHLLRNLYAGQEATELDMEQQTGSK